MPLDEPPIYESRRSWRSMWQCYRVYRDRIELLTLFGRIRLPLAQVVSVQVQEPLVRQMFSRSALRDRSMWSGVKLDWADLCRHVELRTTGKLVSSYRITPEEPREFALAVESALRRYPALAEKLQVEEELRLRTRA